MTKVSIREFRSQMKTYLENLENGPIELVNWDKTVAIVYTPQVDFIKKINLLESYVKELEKQLEEKPQTVYTSSGREEATEFHPLGKCDKCFKYGQLTSKMVPTFVNGEEKDVEMQLCGKCTKNLERHLSQ